MDIRAGIDAKGNLVAFDFTHFYPQYWSNSVQTNAELSGTPLPAVPSYPSGNFWPAPMYELPNARYLVKSVPLVGNWIKVYWMRGGQRPARHVRRRAGDRRAGVRGEDGPGRVPDPERHAGQRHRPRPDEGPASRRPRRGHEGGEVAAAGHGLEPVGRQRRHADAGSPGRTPTTPRPTPRPPPSPTSR